MGDALPLVGEAVGPVLEAGALGGGDGRRGARVGAGGGLAASRAAAVTAARRGEVLRLTAANSETFVTRIHFMHFNVLSPLCEKSKKYTQLWL